MFQRYGTHKRCECFRDTGHTRDVNVSDRDVNVSEMQDTPGPKSSTCHRGLLSPSLLDDDLFSRTQIQTLLHTKKGGGVCSFIIQIF
jgi:hypothetical protein